MTLLTGYANDKQYLPEEPQLDYSFLPIFPIIPPVNNQQALPVQWPPPGFFRSTPQQNGNFQPAYNPIPEQPFKNDAQLDQERQQLAQMNNPGPPASLLWLLALGAGAWYLHKKGKL